MFFLSSRKNAYSDVGTMPFEQIAGLVALGLERERLMTEMANIQTKIDSHKTALQRTREEVDRFFQLSLDLLCVAGTDGYFKVINPSFERVLGYSAKELLATPFVEFVHADDRKATLDELEKLKQGHPTIAFENRYRCKDGTYRWLEWNAMPMAEEGALYSVARDVTAHKELDLKLKAVVESAPIAMILIDPENRIALANRFTATLFGYEPGELEGQPVTRLIPERFREGYLELSRSLPTNPQRVQIGARGNLAGLRRDGLEFPVEVVAGVVELGRTFLLAAVTDMTERTKAMARVCTIFESSPDGILLVGPDGKIALTNTAAPRMFGYESSELAGQAVEMLLPERLRAIHSKHRQSFAREKRERFMGESPYELFGVHKDGHEIPVDIALKPIEMDEGRHVITTIRDLTERRRLEREFLVARQIQRALLPARMPSIPGFEVAADLRSAEATCGDFLKFTPLDDGSLALAVGDVTGHGFGPAILTACVMSYLRAFSRNESELPAVLSSTNKLLCVETRMEDFATALLVRLVPEKRILEYASAGHPYGYVFGRNEKTIQLDSTGPPLGMFDHAAYKQGPSVKLAPGDTLVLVTDGIYEAMSRDERQFGFEGILEAVRPALDRSAAEITEAIYGAVAEFSQTTSRADDMTVLVIKTTPP
jgi:PAS domain S-box-containing protein